MVTINSTKNLLSSNYKLRAGLSTLPGAFETAQVEQKSTVSYSTNMFINEKNYSVNFSFGEKYIMTSLSEPDTTFDFVITMDASDFVNTDFTSEAIQLVFEKNLVPLNVDKTHLFSFSATRSIEDLKALRTSTEFLDLGTGLSNLMELVSNNKFESLKDYRKAVKQIIVRNHYDLNRHQLNLLMNCGKEFSDEVTILFSAFKQLHQTLDNHGLLHGLLSGTQV